MKTNKTCGCCEGLQKLTPISTANRPGLETLRYRVGTHARFLETMKARLSNLYLEIPLEELDEQGKPKISRIYPLRDLTTRADDDPAIALLDAWAVIADVLTFYQERIANEGYLRTATERFSIQELARLVGYKLRPGVAASVYLAFTLEKDYEVEIPAGIRARSLPGPGELPQSFETAEALLARTEWSELKPRMTRPQYITMNEATNTLNADTLYFEGITTNLKPNDPLLFIFGEHPDKQLFCRVQAVEPQAVHKRTKVTLQQASDALVRTISPRAIKESDTLVRVASPGAIREIIAHYSDLTAFGVSPETRMAQEVLTYLDNLQKDMTQGRAPQELAALLDTVYLPELRKEYAIAEEGHYNKLKPWIRSLLASLEACLKRSTTTSRSVAMAREFGSPAPIGELLPQLLEPPSKPPANALRLLRTTAQTFDPRTDIIQRFLITFKPQLQKILYQALARAEVTAAPELQSVEALRVKAAPFGNNAPLKPIYDDQGVIIGHEEWPLVDRVVIGLQLSSSSKESLIEDGHFRSPLNAVISITCDVITSRKKVELRKEDQEEPSIGELGQIRLKINEIEGVEGEEIRAIFYEVLNQTITLWISADNNKNKLCVKINEKEYNKLDKGDSEIWHDSISGSHLRIELTNSGQTFSLVFGIPSPLIGDEWQKIVIPEWQKVVALDAQYDQIIPGSWVVIERPPENSPTGKGQIITKVQEGRSVSKAAYNITGKVTQLTLSTPWLSPTDQDLSVLRQTTIYAQADALTLAEEPVDEEVAGDTIELDTIYDNLESGRWLIVSGERTDIPGTSGVRASELVMLAGITQGLRQVQLPNKTMQNLPGDKLHSTLILANSLAYTYKRDTVTIYGNVVKATHGETREEILGSGDGSEALQSFTLSQSPLTHLAAVTPAGAESTLEVRVNDVRWPEADNLFELGSTDRGYITRTDEDSKTSIIFGDGKHGTRLPTGAENVRAVYRSGIGQSGNVAAEQISLLATRPLGVKGVINPLRASGGADRESRDQARRNAPLAVMALDRLVSVQDYADFVRTYAGIGKASADRLSDGQRQVVHVTIVGADDIPIDETSDLYRNLCRALHQYGDPYQPIQVGVRELKLLVIYAGVRVKPDYLWEKVEPKIRASLLDAFGFERRELGQDVLLSEVISVIQRVPGVAYVDVDLLDSISESEAEDPETLSQKLEELAGKHESDGENGSNDKIDQPRKRIVAEMDRVDAEGNLRVAQLAILSPEIPETLILQEKTT